MALMLIVAGNNGAGKTTLTSSVMGTSLNGFTWINPDDTTDDLIQRYPEFAINRTYPNLAAAWVSEMRVEALIDNGTDFIVETVLASTKYLDRVRKAKTNGMRIGMIYITLENADLAVERVRARVADGGHDVDEEKIRDRWATSQKNLMAFIPLLDDLAVSTTLTMLQGAISSLLPAWQKGRCPAMIPRARGFRIFGAW